MVRRLQTLEKRSRRTNASARTYAEWIRPLTWSRLQRCREPSPARRPRRCSVRREFDGGLVSRLILTSVTSLAHSPSVATQSSSQCLYVMQSLVRCHSAEKNLHQPLSVTYLSSVRDNKLPLASSSAAQHGHSLSLVFIRPKFWANKMTMIDVDDDDDRIWKPRFPILGS